MKYSEVIRDFKTLYRERVDEYVERYIQECRVEVNKGKRKMKSEYKDEYRYFEINFNDFEEWLEKEISSTDGKVDKNTAKEIEKTYYTTTMLRTSDEGYNEQEKASNGLYIPGSVHSTYRIYMDPHSKYSKVNEAYVERAKEVVHSLMNGQPIPLKDGDNTMWIGDGELFYVSPAVLDEPTDERKGSIRRTEPPLSIQYSEDKENLLAKFWNRADIYRVNKNGVTFFVVTHHNGIDKCDAVNTPLNDANADILTDLDVFTDGTEKRYNYPSLMPKLKSEDALKMVGILKGVLQKTSSSFRAFETEIELRKKVEELQAKLTEKETGIAKLMSTYTDKGERDEASISALGEKLEIGKSKIDTLTAENERLTEENDILKKKQVEQTTQIQSLEQNNIQLEAKAKKSEENSDNLRQRTEQLKEKVIQAVGKVPFVGKRVKAIFDEDVLALPPQAQKEDDFRAKLQVTEPSTRDGMDIKNETRPMRKRTSGREDDRLDL